MVKTITIKLDETMHKALSKKKGSMTWEEALITGVELAQKEGK